MQPSVRVELDGPAAQMPGPVDGALELELGRTVTQAPAVRPPAPAVTGRPVTCFSASDLGVPDVACCRSEPSVMRP